MVDVDVVSVGRVPNLVLLQQAGEGCDSVTCSRRLLRWLPVVTAEMLGYGHYTGHSGDLDLGLVRP